MSKRSVSVVLLSDLEKALLGIHISEEAKEMLSDHLGKRAFEVPVGDTESDEKGAAVTQESLLRRFFEAFNRGLPKGDPGASHRAPMMSVEAFDLFCELRRATRT